MKRRYVGVDGDAAVGDGVGSSVDGDNGVGSIVGNGVGGDGVGSGVGSDVKSENCVRALKAYIRSCRCAVCETRNQEKDENVSRR